VEQGSAALSASSPSNTVLCLHYFAESVRGDRTSRLSRK
jgi:hypothetical protein